MSKTTKANRIVDKWKVDLAKLDKKNPSLLDHYDQLFYSLYIAAVEFDIAREIAENIIPLVLPSMSIAKSVWQKRRHAVKMTFPEWLELWKNNIRNDILAAYYEYYPIELGEAKPPPPKQVVKTSKANSLDGMKTDDELNEEDFYRSSKKVTRDNPFIFHKEDKS